jgi:CRP-like cAMP-binding protein
MKGLEIDAAWHGLSSCDRCSIRDLVLFAGLGAEDFQDIHLPIDDLWLPPGATLFRAEEPAQALFTVREGLVKLEHYLPEGTRRIVALAGCGDVVGLEAMLAERYEQTAVVLQAAKVCRIPTAVIGRLRPKLNTQLMGKWHDSVRKAHELIRDLATGTARQRMARLFLILAPAESRRCRLFGREDVGALLGVTTETASKTVAEFKRQGLVRELTANLFERDLARLAAVAEGG